MTISTLLPFPVPFKSPGAYWLVITDENKIMRLFPEHIKLVPKGWLVIHPENQSEYHTTQWKQKFPFHLFPERREFFRPDDGELQYEFWTLPRWFPIKEISYVE